MQIKSAIGLGVAATAVIGYCFYFDRKRRSDPDYRKKVKERRRKTASKVSSRGSASTTKFPDPLNQEACQTFFMQEINLGESLLSQGQVEEGVEHLANAIAIYGQPQQLMQVFAQSLPQEVLQLLALRIPMVKQRMIESLTEGGKMPTAAAAATTPKPKVVELAEEDVE